MLHAQYVSCNKSLMVLPNMEEDMFSSDSAIEHLDDLLAALSSSDGELPEEPLNSTDGEEDGSTSRIF